MDIVLCFDNKLQNYWKHVINSIKYFTEEKCNFYFIIDKNVDIVCRNEYIRNGIEVIEIEEKLDFVSQGSVKSKAQYYRFFIPELLKIEKTIYFDNDVIINADIKELWDLDLKDNYIAAVCDPFLQTLQLAQSWQGNISGTEYNLERLAFLSGQLALNCKAWRENNITDKLFEFVNRQRVGDLLALNCICNDRIIELEKEWSFPAGYYDIMGRCNEPKLKDIVYNTPKLYHYHGIHKPWNSKVYRKELYEKFCK